MRESIVCVCACAPDDTCKPSTFQRSSLSLQHILRACATRIRCPGPHNDSDIDWNQTTRTGLSDSDNDSDQIPITWTKEPGPARTSPSQSSTRIGNELSRAGEKVAIGQRLREGTTRTTTPINSDDGRGKERGGGSASAGHPGGAVVGGGLGGQRRVRLPEVQPGPQQPLRRPAPPPQTHPPASHRTPPGPSPAVRKARAAAAGPQERDGARPSPSGHNRAGAERRAGPYGTPAREARRPDLNLNTAPARATARGSITARGTAGASA